MTTIKPCDCKHESQDRLHGKNKRVFNIGETKQRCTVCGKEKLN